MKKNEEKSVLVRARVPARRLRSAERILGQLGLKSGDAINMLMAQIVLRKGLPFAMHMAERSPQPDDRSATVWTESLGEY